MNVVAGPNPLEVVLLILLGGGFGLPSGVPPTQEDPLAAKARAGGVPLLRVVGGYGNSPTRPAAIRRSSCWRNRRFRSS